MDLVREFYETPAPFTMLLADILAQRHMPILGRVFEPCVGGGAIVRALGEGPYRHWTTNDLDDRWPADFHLDAATAAPWCDTFASFELIDWTITNPPFSQAIEIAAEALAASRVGVAMYLRGSIHEPLQTGLRRDWMARHEPTGTIWLPRFAHQRSRTRGVWMTDSMTCNWVVWLRDRRHQQFIVHAPSTVLDALAAFTPGYREHMDQLMGLTGDERARQAQFVAACRGLEEVAP